MEPEKSEILESSDTRIPIRINLDDKLEATTSSASATACPDRQIAPGDIVIWESSRINDIQKVKVIFTDNKHPFVDPPTLTKNVVSKYAQGTYSYEVFEGDSSLGCGNLTPPSDPPDGGQRPRGSGTLSTR